MLKTLIIISIAVYWPLSLILNSTSGDLAKYLIPGLLLLLSYFLFKKNTFFLVPVLLIPLFSPKLVMFPILFSLFMLFAGKKKKLAFIALAFSLIIAFISWNSFVGQTIFRKDYEAEQKIIRDTQLYDSIFLARTFHNKARLYIDKFNSNFFALIDLNNYFFGNHPRQVPGAQNSERFPFLSVFFFLFGLFYLRKNPDNMFLIASVLLGILSLSVLTIFDGNDFVLWLPLTLVTIFGFQLISKTKHFRIFLLIFLIFTFVEYLRIYIS